MSCRRDVLKEMDLRVHFTRHVYASHAVGELLNGLERAKLSWRANQRDTKALKVVCWWRGAPRTIGATCLVRAVSALSTHR